MANERNVRLSQTLAPFGVGAIYDFVGESLVACETGMWKSHGTRLRLPRLEQQLGVSEFRSAPSHASMFGGSGPKVPYYRFPQWLFCPRCRRMVNWRVRDEVEGEPPTCPMGNCRGQAQLVPMRFIVICEDGHLSDVPWQLWAHIGATTPDQKQCKSKDLSFESLKNVGSGLASLQVRCNTCKTKNTLGRISSKDSLVPFKIRCKGRQPWQKFEETESCERAPQVVQRGASNVYFSRIESALDIPPESDYAAFSDLVLDVTNTPEFQLIVSGPTGPLAQMAKEELADKFDVDVVRIEDIVQDHLAGLDGSATRPRLADETDLATAEWLAFHADQDEVDDRDRFITRRVDFAGGSPPGAALEALRPTIDRVVVGTRLREVRALVSFSRLRPDARQLPPGLSRTLDWLPAIEVFGEGIFVALSETKVASWEEEPAVQAVAAGLETRRQQSLFGPRLGVEATPRFLLLHTLAHLLIRQLAYDCGYAASSLRERIYARTPATGPPQAGILIYTAAGDVEGTLGGLVRQGEPERLAPTLLRALESAAWCSSDPICRESRGQGFGSMNLGACHACTLVSETSCAYFNVLLDRGLIVGADDAVGYFSDVLEAALSESARRAVTK